MSDPTDLRTADDTGDAIAVVGMACRVPGADDPEAFWTNLREGVESIGDLDDDALRDAGVTDAELADPAYVRRGGLLSDMEGFDPGFFGLNPRDGAIMDPQHRHFLECAWEALERSGHPPRACGGPVGVFGGVGMHTYLIENLLTNRRLVDTAGFFLLRHTGNDKDFLTTRVSYHLDLKGPSVSVQTACSTSLVAIHMACQSLLERETDFALAGGATILVPHGAGYRFEEGSILSPDGRCRAFDADARGTVFSSGVGVVVLRRLDDALADGDHVHAVIRGSAVNNDGSLKAGYMAPSVEGQAAAIAEALTLADVDPETVGMIEAHGTGTSVGDPIEVAALTQAFRTGTDATGFCALTSVKPNVGHMDTAAGVAGFIKAVHAVERGEIPPTLHFRAPNPALRLEASPFYVTAEARPWPRGTAPRRAGVSSLGVGGTNAHVVVEQPPEPGPDAPSRPHQLLVLSARTPAALDAATERLAAALEGSDAARAPLADVAFTLAVGREAFPHRRALVCGDRDDAVAALRDPARQLTAAAGEATAVVFMFPGQGAQHVDMARALMDAEPVFRAAMERVAALARPHLGFDLVEAIHPAGGDPEAAAERLRATDVAQPALFAVQHALAELWESRGVRPAAVIGHSIGEYAAAVRAGVFDLAQAVALVCARGRLMQALPSGAMAVVPLAEEAAAPYLEDGLSVAAVNAPGMCVASGPHEAVDRLLARLEADGCPGRRLHTSHAFHSSMMDPALDAFEAEARRAAPRAPTLPMASTSTAGWLTPTEATDPSFWARQIRRPVRFADALALLLAEHPDAVLLEVGPGTTLASLTRSHPAARGRITVSTLGHARDASPADVHALRATGRLWTAGVDVDWAGVWSGERRRRTPLPTYPFQHQRCWIEAGAPAGAPAAEAAVGRPPMDAWFHLPGWRAAVVPPVPAGARGEPVLVLGDGPLVDGLCAALDAAGSPTVRARSGEAFRGCGAGGEPGYALRPDSLEDLRSLTASLDGGAGVPGRVVHAWDVEGDGGDDDPGRTFFSGLHLAQALDGVPRSGPLEVTFVTRGAREVAGEGVHRPSGALLAGPARVMAREMGDVRTRLVDLPGAEGAAERVLGHLAAEVAAGTEPSVAYRGRQRFVEAFEPLPTSPVDGTLPGLLREGGAYLITGGLGGLGLTLAHHLATRCGARLALLSRRELSTDPSDPLARAVAGVEAAGGEVMVLNGDVTDEEGLRRAVAGARARFGRLDGAFHLAGVLDDGLIALKSREAAEAVLRPKVEGTRVLYRVLADDPPDVLVLFSSLSSTAGLAGQVDYTSANAFMDAFARARSADGPFPVVAVDWGVWRGVGMAAAAGARLGLGGLPGEPVDAPLVQRRTRASDDEVELAGLLGVDSHWVLGEHRVRDGGAVLPGTAYLELAREAWVLAHGDAKVTLEDVLFLAPWTPDDDGPAELRVRLSREGDAWSFVVRSPAGGPGAWTEHAQGRLRALNGATRMPVDLAAVMTRCRGTSDARGRDHARLAFGPRWDCLVSKRSGEGEALLELALPEDFADDLDAYGLHPALLDIATGAAQSLVPGMATGEAFYVPFSYGAVRVHAPLERRVFSHVRLRPAGPSPATVTFDVSVTDADGTLLVDVEGFVMKRVADGALDGSPRRGRSGGANDVLARGLREGIGADEGMEALERVLALPPLPQVVVVAQTLASVLEPPAEAADEEDGDRAGDAPVVEADRPALATPYEAPDSPAQETIARLWQDALGLGRVGVVDDFFELGGHSLLLTQVAGRVRAALGGAAPLATLFEHPTVRGWAEAFGSADAAPAEDAAPISRVSRDAYIINDPADLPESTWP